MAGTAAFSSTSASQQRSRNTSRPLCTIPRSVNTGSGGCQRRPLVGYVDQETAGLQMISAAFVVQANIRAGAPRVRSGGIGPQAANLYFARGGRHFGGRALLLIDIRFNDLRRKTRRQFAVL